MAVSSKYGDRVQIITEDLYERYMEMLFRMDEGYPSGGPKSAEMQAFKKKRRSLFMFDAVKRRLVDHLKATGDEDMVWLVCRRLVETGGREFSAVQHMGPLSFEMFARGMRVPDGAWQVARWADQLPDGQLKQSADYWLSQWWDSRYTSDPDEREAEVAEAKMFLGLLMARNSDEEYVETVTI